MITPAILVALVVSVLLGVSLLAIVLHDRRRSSTRGRVNAMLGAINSVGTAEEVAPRLDRQRISRPDAGWRLTPTWLRQRIKNASAVAGGRVTPVYLFLVAFCSTLLAGILSGVLLNLGVIVTAVLCVAAAIGGPTALLRFEKARYDRKFLAVFPDALDLIVRAIRSGLPVTEAVTNVGQEVDDPVGKVFRGVSDEMSIAVDMDRALKQASDQIRITDFQFFAAALALQRQTGGNLADTLTNLSHTVRRRNEVRLKVRALSSEGRISALVLSVMPIILGIAMEFLSPEYIGMLINDPRGHKLIALALVSLAMGIMVMRGMVESREMNLFPQLAEQVAATRERFAGLSGVELTIVGTAIVVAAYSFLNLWIIDRREAIQTRISALRGVVSRPRESLGKPAGNAFLRYWSQRIGTVLAASSIIGGKERDRLARVLTDAGLGGRGRVATLLAVKLLTLMLSVFGDWSFFEFRGLFADTPSIRIAVIGAMGLAAWRLPDMVISTLARRRRSRIEVGLPDALDLLVICAESGLSLEQGINFVAREISTAFPDVAHELETTAAELRVLGDRRQALENLAHRIGLPAVRSIVATLVQTMKYGTPLAHSLRVLAAELRTIRLLKVEEKAAQLPVLLSIPVVGFLLPCTFLVLVGPAVLQFIDTFHNMHIETNING